MSTNDTHGDVSFAVSRMLRGDFYKQLDSIREEYEHVCELKNKYAEQIREWNKDDEIQKAKDLAQYYMGHGLHMLSDKESERVKTFRNMHYKSCNNGSSFTFELVGTGIGEAITIVCPVCGQKEDVTDYDTW